MYFAASLGYKWVLQLDDDSAVHQTIPHNIVEFLNSRDVYLGARIIADNVLDYAWGLPELAKFFIVSESVKASPL
jgi:hypothetical protein